LPRRWSTHSASHLASQARSPRRNSGLCGQPLGGRAQVQARPPKKEGRMGT